MSLDLQYGVGCSETLPHTTERRRTLLPCRETFVPDDPGTYILSQTQLRWLALLSVDTMDVEVVA